MRWWCDLFIFRLFVQNLACWTNHRLSLVFEGSYFLWVRRWVLRNLFPQICLGCNWRRGCGCLLGSDRGGLKQSVHGWSDVFVRNLLPVSLWCAYFELICQIQQSTYPITFYLYFHRLKNFFKSFRRVMFLIGLLEMGLFQFFRWASIRGTLSLLMWDTRVFHWGSLSKPLWGLTLPHNAALTITFTAAKEQLFDKVLVINFANIIGVIGTINSIEILQ